MFLCIVSVLFNIIIKQTLEQPIHRCPCVDLSVSKQLEDKLGATRLGPFCVFVFHNKGIKHFAFGIPMLSFFYNNYSGTSCPIKMKNENCTYLCTAYIHAQNGDTNSVPVLVYEHIVTQIKIMQIHIITYYRNTIVRPIYQ